MTSDETLHLALRAQLLTVSELPAARAWENKKYEPTHVEYIADEFVPATNTLRGSAVGGLIERTGLYIVKVFGLADSGITAIRAIASAILAAFPIGPNGGWVHWFANGDKLFLRNELGPWAGQLLPLDNGLTVCTVTVPYRFWTTTA